jgi:hypothetical protein
VFEEAERMAASVRLLAQVSKPKVLFSYVYAYIHTERGSVGTGKGRASGNLWDAARARGRSRDTAQAAMPSARASP